MEMQHLFSQVTVIADASADASGYTISACSGTVSPSYAADVTDGNRTKRYDNTSKAVNWTHFGTFTATSVPTLIYYEQSSYNDPSLTVTLNSITIDGTTLTIAIIVEVSMIRRSLTLAKGYSLRESGACLEKKNLIRL